MRKISEIGEAYKLMKQKSIPGPYIIALETATEVSSVAVFARDQLIGSLEYGGRHRHAELITVMMETLLRDLCIDKKELAAVAVAKGPGSYTGLRVGVSTVKGLAMALDLPIIAVNSLEGIAWQVREMAELQNAWICPMIDARRMEVYCAVYDEAVQEQQPTSAVIIDPNSFSDLLKEHTLIFAGNGAAKCKPVFADNPRAQILTEIECTARSMGIPVWRKFQAQEFEDLVTFEPYYLKEFIAVKAKDPLKPKNKNT